MTGPELAVETTDLGKRFGSTCALQHCSLEVPVGLVLVVVVRTLRRDA